MAIHSVREELRGVLVFVGVVWCVFGLAAFLPFNINSFGVAPRSLRGLVGIPLIPFLHADLKHLLSNTIPLVVLLVLLAGSNARSWAVVAYIVLVGGGLLWLFGRPVIHIGASGLGDGVIAFLRVSGIIERSFSPLRVAGEVAAPYGRTLGTGVLPHAAARVSWEGHLYGAVAGGLAAGSLTSSRNRSTVSTT